MTRCACCGPGVSCIGDLMDDETGDDDVDEKTDEQEARQAQQELQRRARGQDEAASDAREVSSSGEEGARGEQGEAGMTDLDINHRMRLDGFVASYIDGRPKIDMVTNIDGDKLHWVQVWLGSWSLVPHEVVTDNTDTLRNALAQNKDLRQLVGDMLSVHRDRKPLGEDCNCLWCKAASRMVEPEPHKGSGMRTAEEILKPNIHKFLHNSDIILMLREAQREALEAAADVADAMETDAQQQPLGIGYKIRTLIPAEPKP